MIYLKFFFLFARKLVKETKVCLSNTWTPTLLFYLKPTEICCEHKHVGYFVLFSSSLTFKRVSFFSPTDGVLCGYPVHVRVRLLHSFQDTIFQLLLPGATSPD